MSNASRSVAAALGAVVLVGAVLLPAQSASAHEQLVSSTPATGERLDVAPTEVVLEFSADVLTVGALVLVVDAEGENWAAPNAVYDGQAVRAVLNTGMPEAGYELRWRVVSGDGHPISGLIPFTVGDGEPYSSLDSSEPSSPSAPATPVAEGTGANDGASGALLRIGLIGLGGAAVAVALFLAFEIIQRRCAARRTPPEGAPEST